LIRFDAGGRSGFGGRGGAKAGKGASLGEGLRQPKWDLSKLPKFEKHFYQEHPCLASKTVVCSWKFSVMINENIEYCYDAK
jgi:hypothetical protein